MNAQPLDWNDINLVLAICRSGTLSGAARALGINHSTVFRRINAIEKDLGVRLFDRLPTGYAMTEAGEAVHATAERIENEVFGLSRRMAGRDLSLQGQLRVTAPDGLALTILMPHIASFCRAYPDIRLDFAVTNSFLELSQREADVAIRFTASPPETVVGRRICKFAITVYGAKKYLKGVARNSLETYDWLLPGEGLERVPAAKWLAQHYPAARIALRSNTFLSLREAAKQGLGVAPLPCFLGDREVTLQRLMQPPKELDSELWVLIHPDLRYTARVRVFVDFLVDALKPEQSLIEGRGKPTRHANGE